MTALQPSPAEKGLGKRLEFTLKQINKKIRAENIEGLDPPDLKTIAEQLTAEIRKLFRVPGTLPEGDLAIVADDIINQVNALLTFTHSMVLTSTVEDIVRVEVLRRLQLEYARHIKALAKIEAEQLGPFQIDIILLRSIPNKGRVDIDRLLEMLEEAELDSDTALLDWYRKIMACVNPTGNEEKRLGRLVPRRLNTNMVMIPRGIHKGVINFLGAYLVAAKKLPKGEQVTIIA